MDRKSKTEETPAGRDLIRFDWAMKRLLRNKADYVVLEGFLTVLLGENVKITGIGESEGNRNRADEKSNRVDILVENDAKEILIIEIQNCREMDYLSRMLFGVSKAITDHMKIGKSYAHVRKVYHINIVYFELGLGKDYVYHGSTSFRGIHRGDELQLTPDQQVFFGKKTIPDLYPEYYILKVEDFNGHAKDSLDEWIYYLKNDVILDSFTAPGLREARELLRINNLSPSERAAYDAHLMRLSHEYSIMQTARTEGKAEGLAEGLAEGEEERKKLQEALAQKDNMIANAIKNLVGQGMSPGQVAQILQLDVEEVRKYI
jgi:predicted transposase/invertase (TIGR01784 family)